jgi:solute carrier family 35 protein E1
MWNVKLRYATYIAVLATSTISANAKSGNTSIHRPQSKAHCSSAFKSKDVTFCPSKVIVSNDSAQVSKIAPSFRGGDDGGAVGMAVRLKIGGYFALWYILNIVYNIVNKKYLNVIPAPLTVGSLQFLVGSLYSILLWVTKIRAAPVLTSKGNSEVNKVGFYHMMGQELSMMSLGAGPVSFTHIVKALEPFFSAVVSAVVFGKWMHPMVYVTLIPVVGGVAYACLKERSFSWLAFWTAMGSNLAFALRAVVSKSALDSAGGELGENLTSVNLFGIVTIFAFLQSIPLFLLGEGFSFIDLWKKALANSSSYELVKGLIVSGLFHYLNNEVMYLALSNVHPVTLAVGNTMKRVFIVVASVLVFRNPITVQAAIGSVIGIGGVLLYSLTKQYYEDLEKNKQAVAEATEQKGNNWFTNRGKK